MPPVKPRSTFNRIDAPRAANGRPNPSIATAPEPGAGQTSAQTTTEASTYFTKGDGETHKLYQADRLWVTVTLTLETAGPVSVGFRSAITPVLSGKGQLLATGVPTKFVVAKGNNQLYIASTSVNRVKVTIEPLPWLEQITATARALVDAILSLGKM
jgi:hypothetical protein